MKNQKLYAVIALITSFCFFSSCDKGFTELNTNKIDPTSLNPVFEMNKSIVESNFTSTANQQAWLCYYYGIVQQIIVPFGSSLIGGNYNQYLPGNNDIVWNFYYPNMIKQIVDVVDKTKTDPKQVNLYNSARIWKAYLFMILTDSYGDIPYFEAGGGYINKVTNPKYDAQKEIYKDILKELDEASAALNATSPISTGDIMYGGNVSQWKRFGYSLLLRAAMRHSKIDPTTAETYTKKAIAGGLMQSNADNAVLRHTSLYINWMGEMLNGREKSNFYLAEPFVNYLKNNNDPRLPVFSIRYVGAANGTQQTAARVTTAPASQIGMPMGYNDVSIAATFATKGVVSLWDFSQANTNTVLTTTSPEYFVTYSQTQLLLAEAIVRGWAPGDAASVFANGIRANMEQLAAYGSGGVISPAAIQGYVSNNPLSASTALEQINTQYWVSSFLNGPELFSNFRRSGFPVLTPNPYPGSEVPGAFIRRLQYPNSEYIVNQANIEAANARQGPDKISTRIWWDK